MALAQWQIDRLNQFVTEKWQSSRCQLCQTNSWTITGQVTLQLQDVRPDGAVMNTVSGMPCAAFMCNNCGNTLLVNLVKADAFPSLHGVKTHGR